MVDKKLQDTLKTSLSYVLEKYEITPEEYFELSTTYAKIIGRIYNINLLPKVN
jgi:hypothetical protein